MAADTKFDPRKIEETVLAEWEQSRAYLEWKKRQAGKPTFVFIDGPPFPTGKIHVGTAWNKVMKDAVLRYKAMRGFQVNDTPGYDMHGLPVELKVERELKIRNKKEIEDTYGIAEFVKRCREFAAKNLDVMSAQFKRLGVWMDWEHPYKTTEDYYIEGCWWAIKKASDKGMLYKGKKVVTVCPRCETAIAKHEQEYKTVKENSVYAKFPIAGKPGEFIVIWTTTPWTLPTNMAVMVHPDLEYVRAQVKQTGEVWLLAKGLANAFFGVLGQKYEILDTFNGSKLDGLKYHHPLEEEMPIHKKFDQEVKRAHTVILSEEYVSLQSGTGCVHCAPGTGPEDFEVGQRNGIPPFCPLELSGKFTNDGGKYAGLYAKKDCDPAVLDDLKAKGLLVHEVEVEHEYPTCWRCKTQLIFLTTGQWFLATSKLKEEMLKENEEVKWIPDWAGNKWFASWLHGLQDWCISKQRYWGVPLPIWLCEKCGNVEVVGTFSELAERTNLAEKQDFHRPGIDALSWACHKCGGTVKRVSDILDVWVESGAAVWASQKYPSSGSLLFPADFIIEGKDQIRGWFYSLMGLSTIVFGKAPYKAVYMHGMTNDEQGRKFSKSLGNFVSPEEVIEKYGSEPFRFFAIGAAAPGEDITYGHRYVAEAFTDLSVLWNSFMFAAKYMALDNYSPVSKPPANLQVEDKWIISRVNTLTRDVTAAFDAYELPKIPKLLKAFFIDDLSRWYIKLIRDRTWVTASGEDKEAAYLSLYYSLDRLLKLVAPVVPMLSEAIYKRFTKVLDPSALESVHFQDWPAYEDDLRDNELEENMKVAKAVVEASMMARDKAKIKLRWPVREILVEPVEFQESVKRMNESRDTRGLSHGNVVDVQKIMSSPGGAEIPKQDSQFHHSLGRTDTRHLPLIIQSFSPIICRLCNSKSTEIGKPTDISKYESVHIVGLSVHLLKERDAELIDESVLRELSRKVQSLRKEQGLDVSDRIGLSLSAPEEIRKIVDAAGAEFKNKIGAEKVNFLETLLETKDELETEKGKVRLNVKKL